MVAGDARGMMPFLTPALQPSGASRPSMASSMEAVAMDCEMVGLGPNNESGLARCSLVDIKGGVVYDKFIRPEGEITNYRTAVSGVTARHMEKATPFAVARLEVSEGPCARRARAGGAGRGGLQTPSPQHRHTSLAPSPNAGSLTCAPHPCAGWGGARAWRSQWGCPMRTPTTCASGPPAGL